MKRIKLTKKEEAIENALLQDEYVNLDKQELSKISKALERRKKDTVLNIRVNSQDLKSIKQKAKKLGIKYQTFLSEIIHKVAL